MFVRKSKLDAWIARYERLEESYAIACAAVDAEHQARKDVVAVAKELAIQLTLERTERRALEAALDVLRHGGDWTRADAATARVRLKARPARGIL